MASCAHPASPVPMRLSPASVNLHVADVAALIHKGFSCNVMPFSAVADVAANAGSVFNQQFSVCIHTKRYQSIHLQYESIQPPRRFFRSGAGAGRSGAGYAGHAGVGRADGLAGGAAQRLDKAGRSGAGAGQPHGRPDQQPVSTRIRHRHHGAARGAAGVFRAGPCHGIDQPRQRAARGAAAPFRRLQRDGTGQPRQRPSRRCDSIQPAPAMGPMLQNIVSGTGKRALSNALSWLLHVLNFPARAYPCRMVTDGMAGAATPGAWLYPCFEHPVHLMCFKTQTVVFSLVQEPNP